MAGGTPNGGLPHRSKSHVSLLVVVVCCLSCRSLFVAVVPDGAVSVL